MTEIWNCQVAKIFWPTLKWLAQAMRIERIRYGSEEKSNEGQALYRRRKG